MHWMDERDQLREFPEGTTLGWPWKHECEYHGDMDGMDRCFALGHPCESFVTANTGYDQYQMDCVYSSTQHPRTADGRELHRAIEWWVDEVAELGEFFPALVVQGNPQYYMEFTGGGYCAGDELPVHIIRHLDRDMIEVPET